MSTRGKSLEFGVGLFAQEERLAGPRLLLIRCEREAFPDDSTGASEIARQLKGEGWSAELFDLPASRSSRLFSSKSLPARLIAKAELIGSLCRVIPRYDALHLQAGSVDAIMRLALPALVLGKFFGKKVLLHFDRSGAEDFIETWGSWFRFLLKSADQIVVGSRYLQRIFSRAQLKVVRLVAPVSTKQCVHQEIRDLQPNILLHCPLEVEYNVVCALKAFRLTKQKYPRAELMIVGDGPRMDELEQFVTDEHIYGVTFAGDMPADAMTELYDEADLFLRSSTIDESPPALARAFAAGLPVVTTDADGLLHLVRDRVNALVVPVNDHVQLADRMIELVENSDLAGQLSCQGKIEAEQQSWTKVRQAWIDVYHRLAG